MLHCAFWLHAQGTYKCVGSLLYTKCHELRVPLNPTCIHLLFGRGSIKPACTGLGQKAGTPEQPLRRLPDYPSTQPQPPNYPCWGLRGSQAWTWGEEALPPAPPPSCSCSKTEPEAVCCPCQELGQGERSLLSHVPPTKVPQLRCW